MLILHPMYWGHSIITQRCFGWFWSTTHLSITPFYCLNNRLNNRSNNLDDPTHTCERNVIIEWLLNYECGSRIRDVHKRSQRNFFWVLDPLSIVKVLREGLISLICRVNPSPKWLTRNLWTFPYYLYRIQNVWRIPSEEYCTTPRVVFYCTPPTRRVLFHCLLLLPTP